MNNTMPLVSVSTITYNHAKFIRKCLDGVLSQQTSFPIEYLIHDDCSTDGTIEILKEYEAKYPDILNVVYETENQYSKGGSWGSAVWNYPRAKGKYIALCEGDDYWTDPLKLQKQVDFMESHPEYSVCFCCYTNYDTINNQYYESDSTQLVRKEGSAVGMEITYDHFLHNWVFMPMTILFRANALDFSLPYLYKYYRDVHEAYHLMQKGKCYLFAFDGGVHNMHDGGVATNLDIEKRLKSAIEIAEELYYHNKDEVTKANLVATYKWKLQYAKRWGYDRVLYSWRILHLDHKIISCIKNITRK